MLLLDEAEKVDFLNFLHERQVNTKSTENAAQHFRHCFPPPV